MRKSRGEDGRLSPHRLLPLGVVTAVELCLIFVAPAQMRPGLESKARFVSQVAL